MFEIGGPEVVDVAIDEAGPEVVDSLRHELAALLRAGTGDLPIDRLRDTLEEYGDALLAAASGLPSRGLAEPRRADLLIFLLDEAAPGPLVLWAVTRALNRFQLPEGLPDEQRVVTHLVERFGDLAVDPLLHHLEQHGDADELELVWWVAERAPDRARMWGERLFERGEKQAIWGAAALVALGDDGREVLLEYLDASRADTRLRAIGALMRTPDPALIRAFRARLDGDRSKRVREALRDALFTLEQQDETPIDELAPTPQTHAALDERLGRYALELPRELDVEVLPPLRWTSGEPLSTGARRWVLGRLGRGERDADLQAVGRHLDPRSKSAMLAALTEQYQGSDEARIGWVLFATVLLGSDDAMTDFGRGLDAIARGSSWVEALRRLEVMRRHGAPAAIQWIDRWARTAKSRALREHAIEALDEMAAEAGVSRDELTEAAMADFGFDDRGRLQVEWATRGTMTVALGPSNELILTDEAGKVWDRYPGVLKADDPDEVARAKRTVSNLKKQVKLATRGQVARMERAMVVGRTWTADSFAETLRNPLIGNLARQLLWGAFTDGELVEGFRVAQDGTLADVADDVFEIGERDVRLVHRLHLSDETLSRWGEVFVDYELIPIFEQLSRRVFTPTSAELRSTDVLRFADRFVSADRLRYHFERKNWIRGDSEDGLVYWVTRPFPTHDLTAIAWIAPGYSVIRGDREDPQEVEKVQFLRGVRRGPTWGGREQIPLADVEPLLFSEVLLDIEDLVGGLLIRS